MMPYDSAHSTASIYARGDFFTIYFKAINFLQCNDQNNEMQQGMDQKNGSSAAHAAYTRSCERVMIAKTIYM